MNTITEIPSSFRVTGKKIQFNPNQNFQKKLTYSPSSKVISFSTVIKYTRPQFETAGQSQRIRTNSCNSLDSRQLEMQKLAMELDRKRERFNQITFFL